MDRFHLKRRACLALAAGLLALAAVPGLAVQEAVHGARLMHTGTIAPTLTLLANASTVAAGKPAFVAVRLDPGGSDPHSVDGAQFTLRYDPSKVEVVTTTLIPTPGQAATPGQTVLVTGAEFAPSQPVTISLGDTSKIIDTNASGGFSDSIVAPLPGTFPCTFTDPYCSNYKLSATQTVNSQTVTIARPFSVAGEVMNIFSGDDQVGTVNTTLTGTPLVVQLSAAALSGKTVRFSISGPSTAATGQSVSPETAMTDGNGRTSTTVTLGNEGGIYTVAAKVDLSDSNPSACDTFPSECAGDSPGEQVRFHIRAVPVGATATPAPKVAPGACNLPTLLQNEAGVESATVGKIRYAAGSILSGGTPVTAPCSLAFITFKGKAVTSTPSPLAFVETTKVTEGGNAPTVTTTDGTISVTPVNAAPQGADTTITIDEDTPYTFVTADFGFSDPNDSPPHNLLAVKVTTLPAAGSLANNNIAVTAGQSVAAADVAAGKLKFSAAAGASGSPYASFTFQVQDNGGTANGGIDLDQTPNTITVNVTPVNDAPQGADKTITITQDTTYTFTSADFGFSDPNDTPPNTLLAVKFTTLPSAGALSNNNVAVTAGQFVTAADIAAGNLKFAPVAGATGSPYASFTFQVQDNGGTANSGVDLDQSPNTITMNVSATPTMAVTGISPNGIKPSSSGTFRIEGSGFASGCTVQVGGTGVTADAASCTATAITVRFTATGNAAVGQRDVTVTNPGGASASGLGILTVTSAPQVFVDPEVRRIPFTTGASRTVSLKATPPTSPPPDPANLGSWTVQLRYDPTVVSIPEGGCVTVASTSCNPSLEPGVLQTTGSSGGGLTGTQTLVTITFALAGNVARGSVSPLQPIIKTFTNNLGDDIPNRAATGGEITVGCIPYDVNCNGTVTAVDALCVARKVDQLAAIANCPADSEFDTNRVGGVTAVDALCVARRVDQLSPIANCPAFALTLSLARGLAGSTVVATASAFYFAAGTAVELRLDTATGTLLTNASVAEGATFTASFTVPVGTTLGAHSIRAVVGGSIRDTASFEVQAP